MSCVTIIIVIGFISSVSGQVITRSVDVACPGQEVIFRCAEPGSRIRWVLRGGGVSSGQIFFYRDGPFNQEETIDRPPLIARLVNLGVNGDNKLVSEVYINASQALNGTQVECSGTHFDTDDLIVAAQLPAPANLRELYHHRIINSSMVLLSWDLTTAQLRNNLLDGFLVSVPALGVTARTTDPVISLLLPNNSASISILVSSCNCVSCGNAAMMNWTSSATVATSCYVPRDAEVTIVCDQHFYPLQDGGNTSTITFACTSSQKTTAITSHDRSSSQATTAAVPTTSSVDSVCKGTTPDLSSGIVAAIVLAILCLLALVAIVIGQTWCILKLKHKVMSRRVQPAASNGVLEHADSVRYSEQPLSLGPLPPAPSPLYDTIRGKIAVSKIDLRNNDAYTYNSDDYYT